MSCPRIRSRTGSTPRRRSTPRRHRSRFHRRCNSSRSYWDQTAGPRSRCRHRTFDQEGRCSCRPDRRGCSSSGSNRHSGRDCWSYQRRRQRNRRTPPGTGTPNRRTRQIHRRTHSRHSSWNRRSCRRTRRYTFRRRPGSRTSRRCTSRRWHRPYRNRRSGCCWSAC